MVLFALLFVPLASLEKHALSAGGGSGRNRWEGRREAGKLTGSLQEHCESSAEGGGRGSGGLAVTMIKVPGQGEVEVRLSAGAGVGDVCGPNDMGIDAIVIARQSRLAPAATPPRPYPYPCHGPGRARTIMACTITWVCARKFFPMLLFLFPFLNN